MATEDGVDVRISVRGLLEEFTCPICLMPITDCYITPCGHNACAECLREWIGRAHSCPVCTAADVTAAKIIKNHCFDNIYQKVTEARERAAKDYFKRIAEGGGGGADVGVGAGGASAGASPDGLSPIEAVFQKHMQRSLSAYQSYVGELRARLERRLSDVAATFALRAEEVRASSRALQRLAQTADVEPPTPVTLVRSPSLEVASSKMAELVRQRDAAIAEQQARYGARDVHTVRVD